MKKSLCVVLDNDNTLYYAPRSRGSSRNYFQEDLRPNDKLISWLRRLHESKDFDLRVYVITCNQYRPYVDLCIADLERRLNVSSGCFFSCWSPPSFSVEECIKAKSTLKKSYLKDILIKHPGSGFVLIDDNLAWHYGLNSSYSHQSWVNDIWRDITPAELLPLQSACQFDLSPMAGRDVPEHGQYIKTGTVTVDASSSPPTTVSIVTMEVPLNQITQPIKRVDYSTTEVAYDRILRQDSLLGLESGSLLCQHLFGGNGHADDPSARLILGSH